jgi:hypothetical protein
MFVCRFELKEKKENKIKKIKKNKKKNGKGKGKMDVTRTCCFSELKRL